MTTSTTASPPRDTSPWAGAGAAASLIGLAAMTVVYAPQPLLAEIGDDFGRSAVEASLLMSATTMGIALGVFPMAWLSALSRPFVLMGAALALGAACTVLTAYPPTWGALVASRLLAGVVISAVLVTALVWAARSVPAERSRQVAALYVAGTTGGGIAGRLVSGQVAERAGWHWGIVAVDAVVVLCALVGVVLGVRFGRSQRVSGTDDAAPLPLVDRPAMRRILYALGFLGTVYFVGIFSAISFRMAAPPFDWGVGAISLLYLTYLAGTVASVWSGWLVERLGTRRAVMAGLALAAMGLVATLAPSALAVLAGLSLLAAGFFVVHGTASSTVPRVSMRPSHSSAWYTLLYYAGASLGSVAMGMAWDLAAWPAVVIGSLAVMAAAAVLSVKLPLTVSADQADASADLSLTKGNS